MNFLEQRIASDGKVYPGDVLKIDNFLNHQIDITLIKQIAREFAYRFEGTHITKILTIEASGIAIATLLADIMRVPMVFAKKAETVNCTDDKYISQAFSFTHKAQTNVLVSKPYLSHDDKILIVDDFLADGQAAKALIDIAQQAGASVEGICIAVEKSQQKGGESLRKAGFRVESIARIEHMDYQTQSIKFLQGEDMMWFA